ncbi:polysaccharide biosynthesis C-terminal domain-containing protein [Anaerotruncus colihominis]|uniref:oligosaccharide flippase family protein n=1 Tax=Anaerotruncus colihominis TaxID=169435 RepID=UPI00242C86DA|nr:polysaccharide biosynthesis C-terminal domain-containing protein [Anaerotruncus colihominis]
MFAIGTFSSKVLVFLLVPFYTRVLTTDQLGTGDLIVKTANLIIPLASIGMSNAIIRFGLDRANDKRDVFTGALTAIGSGYLIFLLLYPALARFHLLDGNAYLVYIYVLTACLRSLCSQFVRARQLVRLYAFDGVMATATVILFNVVFLVVFKLGVTGYVLATILSDLLSALFLFTIANLRRYIRFFGCDWSVAASMVRYALPLIPTNIFWWITNASDAFFIAYYLGQGANGLLTVAYKVPTIINLLAGIFSDAWQLSAFTEDRQGRTRFFSNVFASYQALIFTSASGLILLCKWINRILAYGEYYESWRFIPVLLLATSFSCLVSFLGTIYMLEKKSLATLVTTALGAGINIILNMALIPNFGVQGGVVATLAGYLVVFTVRIIDTRRIVPLHWHPFKLLLNLALLGAQTYILLTFETGWLLPEIGLCLVVTALNFRLLLQNVQRLLMRRRA